MMFDRSRHSKTTSGSSADPSNNNKSRSRIPVALQAVFLASNRGKDVHKPPPEKAASKTFFGNWLFQRKTGSRWRTTPKKNLIEPVLTAPSSEQPAATENEPLKTSGRNSSSQNLLSPQVYLDAMLRHRGYSTKRYHTLQSAYYNKPSPHQRASYNVHLIALIRKRQFAEFAKVMECGLSSNPCNQFSESFAHAVCRHGSPEMVAVLQDRGCDFRIADDYGRTPLHDACWAAEPAFPVVQQLLQHDLRMFHMIDARGHCPLNYVRKEHYEAWIDFLDQHRDEYWPKREPTVEQAAPALVLQPPNSRIVPDPEDAISCELASLVAAGRIKPSEALFLHQQDQMDTTEGLTEDDADDWDSDDDDEDDDSDYDSDEESSWDSDEEEEDEALGAELEGLLQGLPAMSIQGSYQVRKVAA